jgi:hypothetical protein
MTRICWTNALRQRGGATRAEVLGPVGIGPTCHQPAVTVKDDGRHGRRLLLAIDATDHGQDMYGAMFSVSKGSALSLAFSAWISLGSRVGSIAPL